MKRQSFTTRSSLPDLAFGLLAMGFVLAILVLVFKSGPSSDEEITTNGSVAQEDSGGPPAFDGPGVGDIGGRGGPGRGNRQSIQLLKRQLRVAGLK